jgi:hypothetical protein
MSTPAALELTLADALRQLGGISPKRIRFHPAPGTATENDVITIRDRERRLFELVDGVLVEKVMGYWESALAIGLAEPIVLTEKQTLGCANGFWRSDGEVDIKQEQGLPRMEQLLQG